MVRTVVQRERDFQELIASLRMKDEHTSGMGQGKEPA